MTDVRWFVRGDWRQANELTDAEWQHLRDIGRVLPRDEALRKAAKPTEGYDGRSHVRTELFRDEWGIE